MNRSRTGLWWLVVGVWLLSLALSGCAGADNNWTGEAGRGTDRSQTLTQAIPVGQYKSLILRAGPGEVEISTWGQPTVGLEVEKRASGADPGAVDAYLEGVKVEEKAVGETVQVTTQLPGPPPPGVRFWGVRYLIRVPVSVRGSLDVEADRATVKLTGLSGEAKVTVRSADAEVRNFTGSLKLAVENGQTLIQGFDGQLDVKSNGPVEVTDARLAGRGRVETANSRLAVSLADLSMGQYEFLTSNAPVKVAVPYGSAVRLRVATTNGKVFDELPLTWVDRNETDAEGVYHFEGWLNAGGAQVGVVTTNADVTLSYR